MYTNASYTQRSCTLTPEHMSSLIIYKRFIRKYHIAQLFLAILCTYKIYVIKKYTIIPTNLHCMMYFIQVKQFCKAIRGNRHPPRQFKSQILPDMGSNMHLDHLTTSTTRNESNTLFEALLKISTN